MTENSRNLFYLLQLRNWLLPVWVGCFFSGYVAAEAVSIPNFEIGLGGGFQEGQDQEYHLDLVVNMPVKGDFGARVFIASDYVVAKNTEEGFAQSEFAGNFFFRNQYGRLGLGAGYQETKPDDSSRGKESTSVLRGFADAYIGHATLLYRNAEFERQLEISSSETIGVAYFLDEEQRLALRRESLEESASFELEWIFQPEQYAQVVSVGLLARKGEGRNYIGLLANYYFDTRISLFERYRQYR